MHNPEIAKQVADQIVRSLENGLTGEWEKPWICENGIPTNAVTGKPYQGTNILAFWASEIHSGYSSNLWAGFKQWSSVGAQVRKGEKSTTGIFFQYRKSEDKDGKENWFPFTKTIKVFNADQVDGFEKPILDAPNKAERNTAAEQVILNTGAVITYQGDRACYSPTNDCISMPPIEAFRSTEGFYGVHFHELAHWTGAEKRLDRKIRNRFGDDEYAMEELIAELSDAITCLNLGISTHLREDHAHYIKGWLRCLKNDTKQIYFAAGKAQQATNYILKGPPEK